MKIKKTFIPSICLAAILGVLGALCAPMIHDIWPSALENKADEFARAIAAANKLDRNSKLKQEELAHHYLERFQTPQEISQSIADDLNNQPKINHSASAEGKYTVEQLEKEFIKFSIPELEEIIVEIAKSRKPSIVIFIILSAIAGVLLGFLLPIIIGISWRFCLDCIRQLSLAVQGKSVNDEK
jgi:hypothetical protein